MILDSCSMPILRSFTKKKSSRQSHTKQNLKKVPLHAHSQKKTKNKKLKKNTSKQNYHKIAYYNSKTQIKSHFVGVRGFSRIKSPPSKEKIPRWFRPQNCTSGDCRTAAMAAKRSPLTLLGASLMRLQSWGKNISPPASSKVHGNLSYPPPQK